MRVDTVSGEFSQLDTLLRSELSTRAVHAGRQWWVLTRARAMFRFSSGLGSFYRAVPYAVRPLLLAAEDREVTAYTRLVRRLSPAANTEE